MTYSERLEEIPPLNAGSYLALEALCRELIAEIKQLKDVKKRAEKAWMALDDISVFGDIPIGEKP